MTEEHDDWLWTGEGPVSLEVAGIERELRTLAWQPRALVLPESTTERHSSRWWTPLLAGLAAAAAVLALLMWLRDREEPNAPADPSVQPSGPPSPELVDPFGSDAPSVETPVLEEPELVDPFANEPSSPPPPLPAPRPQGPRTSPDLPDLKDPFQNSRDETPSEPRCKSPSSSPDLKDPFSR
jgi:hypothetical protein